MIEVLEITFWVGVLWLVYVYAGYPIILYVVGLLRLFKPRGSNKYIPRVSVLISARNEESNIGWKIAETLNWDYPEDHLEVLVASDASQDGTDNILREIANARFSYLRLDQRKGKAEALNQLSRCAQGELFFFTDANSHISPTCLKAVVRHFADSRVGCVTGTERTTREGISPVMTQGTTTFLDYESMINKLESRIGSVLVCDGSIFCVRRSLFTILQPDIANDLELPIRIGAEGWKVIFESGASSFESAAGSPKEEYRRKRRICAQGLLGGWRLRRELRGFRAWQFLSRKVLRWFGVVPLSLILLSNLQLISHPFFALLSVCQLVFYSLAAYGCRLANQNRRGNWLTTIAFYFVAVNVAAFAGVIQTILGRRFSLWESPEQSRRITARAPASEIIRS